MPVRLPAAVGAAHEVVCDDVMAARQIAHEAGVVERCAGIERGEQWREAARADDQVAGPGEGPRAAARTACWTDVDGAARIDVEHAGAGGRALCRDAEQPQVGPGVAMAPERGP